MPGRKLVLRGCGRIEGGIHAARNFTDRDYLARSGIDSLQAELIEGGVAPEMPAAIVYKATWPDERIYRCTVGALAATARENRVTKTALVIVGGFLGHEYDRCKLYSPDFSTEFRSAKL